MNHERLRELLPAYLEDDLSGRGRRTLARHLDGCDDCRRELFELRRTVYLLRSLAAEAPPDGLADRVLTAVAEAGPPSALVRLRGSIGGFLDGPFGAPLLTASVGLVALVAVYGVEIEVRWLGGSEREATAVEGAGSPSRPSAGASTAATSRALASAEPAAAASPRRARRASPAPKPPAPESLARAASGSGVPLPAACLEQPGSPACLPWHSFLVGLAVHDTPAFLAEVDAVPGASRERWLGELSRLAGPSGSALVAARLRAEPDPRAARVASPFERIAAGPRR